MDTSLPLTKFQSAIADCSKEILPQSVRYRALNAFKNLRRAWLLYDVDAEMSALRGIIAEEEAAAALILALKHRHYPNSQQLDHKKHDVKTAVGNFIDLVARSLVVVAQETRPQIDVQESSPPRITIKANLSKAFEHSQELWGQPDEPLNFSLRKGSTFESLDAYDFDEELFDFVESRGLDNFVAAVREEANFRNRLQYAADNGIPMVEFPREVILTRAKRVAATLAITIAILQTAQIQLFASQCLAAFLRAMKKVGIVRALDMEPSALQNGLIIDMREKAHPSVYTRKSFKYENSIGYRLLTERSVIARVGLAVTSRRKD